MALARSQRGAWSWHLLHGGALALRQEFFERLPVVFIPAVCEVFSGAGGEADVVKDNFCAGGLNDELEFSDGKDAGGPTGDAPGLDDALVWQEFELAADDVAAEDAEGAAEFAADLGGIFVEREGGAGAAEDGDFLELQGIGEGFVDAGGRGFEGRFLMDGFGRVGDAVVFGGASFRGDCR